MLTLTETATTEIRNIIDQPEVPEGCGLRIAADPAAGGLSLTLATAPVAGDEVVDNSGARVFLDPQAALMLDDQALDAGTDSDGKVQFAVAPRQQ